MVFLDGTNERAHQKAAEAAKKGVSTAERDAREALGRSRGGYVTKACVIADGQGRAIDTIGVAYDHIRSIIERVEKVEEEIKDLMEAKNEIFLEAKGEVLDVEILKLRKLDQDERDEHETLLDVYMRAMDAPSTAPAAEAA